MCSCFVMLLYFLALISVSFANSTQNFTSREPGVYPLVSQTCVDTKVPIVFILPKAEKESSTWNIYSGDSSMPIESGPLSSTMTSVFRTVQYSKDGKYRPLLLVKSSTGSNYVLYGDTVEVLPNTFLREAEKFFGFALGVISTLLIFVGKHLFEKHFKRGECEKRLKTKLASICKTHLKHLKVSPNEAFPKRPPWYTGEEDSDISFIFTLRKFNVIRDHIDKACSVQAGSPSDPNSVVRNELEAALSLILCL